MLPFEILCGFHTLAFFIITIQLLIVKPKSKKVMIPLVLAVSTGFLLLVAIDFFFEVHKLHATPKEIFTKSHTKDETSKKKKGKGFKSGYFVIYCSMCIVIWFIFLAYKDLEEDLQRKRDNEQHVQITISHIT